MGITIADNDKLQFYLEEVYDSNCFDKQEMLTWEQQPTATKTNYDLARAYFECIVKATNTYEQNAGGGMAGRNCYESANQMADIGDEICKYIQQLASAGAANATDTADNAQTKEKLATMEPEIKKLTATIAAMTTKMSNNENRDPNIGTNRDGGRERVTRRPQMTRLRNMGALLPFARVPSSRRQPRQHHLQMEKGWAQQRRHLDKPPRWQHVLAMCQASGDQAARASNVERQVSPHQLTGTRVSNKQKKDSGNAAFF